MDQQNKSEKAIQIIPEKHLFEQQNKSGKAIQIILEFEFDISLNRKSIKREIYSDHPETRVFMYRVIPR